MYRTHGTISIFTVRCGIVAREFVDVFVLRKRVTGKKKKAAKKSPPHNNYTVCALRVTHFFILFASHLFTIANNKICRETVHSYTQRTLWATLCVYRQLLTTHSHTLRAS